MRPRSLAGFLALLVALIAPAAAIAQSAPNWAYGYVPTPAEWNAAFASKQDYISGGIPGLTTSNTFTGLNTFTVGIVSGGTVTITPTPSSLTQGLNISQTSPIGTFPSTNFNIINVVDQGMVITPVGPNPDAYGLSNQNTMGLRVNYSVTPGNPAGDLRGALSGALRTTAAGTSGANYYGVGGSVYTNFVQGGGGGLWGTLGIAQIGPAGSAGLIIGVEGEMAVAVGGSVGYRIGVSANSQGPVAGYVLDAGYMINSGPNVGSAPFKKAFAFASGVYGGNPPIDTAGDVFFADAPLTVANVFNLPNMTVTNNFADFPNFGISGAGQASLGLPISTIPANYGLRVSGVSKGTVGLGVSVAGSTTGSSFIEIFNSTNAADVVLQANEAARTTVRYGVTLGNTTELTAFSGNVLILGTQSSPMILGTNNVNRVQIAISGCVSVGNTTDCAAPGIINLLTGIRIGNAATSGNVLRGNGTNFVSAQLACSDLSGAGSGCSSSAGITALTGDVTASGSGSVAATLATAQPSVHTWASLQTFSAGITNTGNIISGTFQNVVITAPGSTATFTLASAKTFTVNNSLTLAGTDSTTITFQGTDTYVGRATTDTMANKTLTTPVINGLPTGTGVASTNTASTLVARDGSGNFSAGLITSAIHAGGSAAGSTLTIESTSGAGTTDEILLKTGSQVDRMQIDTGGHVNIGPNVASTANLTINRNTVSPSSVANATLQMNGADGAFNIAVLDSYGTGAFGVRAFRSARGTGASFTASQSGDGLGLISFVGASAANTFANTGGGNGGAFISGAATENWSATAQGAQLKFFVTPNTTAAISLAMVIQNSTGLSVGVGAADPGAGKINALNGYSVGAGATAGVSCSGVLTGSAVVTNGIVTHC